MATTNASGLPSIIMGAAHKGGVVGVVSGTVAVLDAVNEAIIMYGRVWTEDGSSHTIDTTGSSSLGWRSGTLTFANAGTTVKIGLAAVDAAAGPPARAANAANVITFDVSSDKVGGGGGITASSWQESVPTTGTKTIANGDLVAFCVQMTARGGTDAVRVETETGTNTPAQPGVTTYLGAAYADATRLPNAVITFSDGVRGYFVGGYVASVGSSLRTYNNTSGTKEYGNLLNFPFPVRCVGISANVNPSADFELVLYSAPTGTPVAERTISVDLNQVASATGEFHLFFSSAYDIPASTDVVCAVKPTSASNVGFQYLTLANTAHQTAWNNGPSGYGVSRNTGAFASDGSGLLRYGIGLIIGGFDNAVAADTDRAATLVGGALVQ